MNHTQTIEQAVADMYARPISDQLHLYKQAFIAAARQIVTATVADPGVDLEERRVWYRDSADRARAAARAYELTLGDTEKDADVVLAALDARATIDGVVATDLLQIIARITPSEDY